MRTWGMSLSLIVLAACSNDGSATNQAKTTDETPRKLAGVYPEQFKCDSIATTDVLAQVLGGTVKQIDNPGAVPRGIAHPCNYEVELQQPEVWTFDFDCRDGMKQRADALFKQYTQNSAEQVELYNGLSDAGPKEGAATKRDAGVRDKDAGIDAPPRAPEAAQEVMVGMKGLDHHGQGLIFIDDDAPCYVRVTGPDSGRRLELAKLLAKNLTFANAPMTPRPFK